MSRYTTEVRYICEEAAGLTESVGFNSIDEVLSPTNVAKVFQGIDYPIYDEAYRPVLNKKILLHFYTREIGMETVGLWKLRMRIKLNDIMPLYNKYYESALLQFNPFYDVDLTTEGNRSGENNKEASSTAESSSTGSSQATHASTTESEENGSTANSGAYSNSGTNSSQNSHTNRYSDTPQGGLNSMTEIQNNLWLTNATLDDGNESGQFQDSNTHNDSGTSAHESTTEFTGNDTGTTSGSTQSTGSSQEQATNTMEYFEHVFGKRGGISYSKMLKEFRDTFMNIDLMVLDELDECFMGLW